MESPPRGVTGWRHRGPGVTHVPHIENTALTYRGTPADRLSRPRGERAFDETKRKGGPTMAAFSDWDSLEYQALMARGRDAERTALVCWTASGIAAAVLLSWGIAAKSASLMLPVIFATAFGFYAAVHGRQQVRLIAGYVKEFMEPNGNSGPQWFTRLAQLEVVPGFNPSGDWAVAALANLTVVTAMAFSWIYAGGAGQRGDLMAGIATGLGLVFCFHSITETARIRQTNAGALWRQITSHAEERRGPRLASRG